MTKTTIKRKLDKLFSEYIRSRGYCVKCRKTNYLQNAHIFSRSNLSVRWDLDNMLCLCPDCHINFAHKNPILFTEFVREYLGAERYEQLKVRARAIKQWKLDEMVEFYESMKVALKERGLT